MTDRDREALPLPTSIQDLRDIAADYERSPKGVAQNLRLDLADIIYRHLEERRISQRKFAEMAGMKASQLSHILHSSRNWTTETAGRLVGALGIQLELIEKPLQSESNGVAVYVRAGTGELKAAWLGGI